MINCLNTNAKRPGFAFFACFVSFVRKLVAGTYHHDVVLIENCYFGAFDVYFEDFAQLCFELRLLSGFRSVCFGWTERS